MEQKVNICASSLGTKEYWDQLYQVEIENFNEYKDAGEIWFGKACETKLLGWMCQEISDKSLVCILDLGCGNGHFLLRLAKAGFTKLHGLDYSPNAIQLAKALFEENQLSSTISLMVGDIFAMDEKMQDSFDLIFDKGTFDAVCLRPASENINDHQRIDEIVRRYRQGVGQILKNNGRLVITSCNWSQSELIQLFCSGKSILPLSINSLEFETAGTIDHPKFQFGGAVGQVVSTVIFMKK